MCVKFKMGRATGFLCLAGPERQILVRGKVWRFEMHRYFGPMPINKRGDGIDGTKPFWEAVTHWCQQGEQIGEDGLCVWSEPVVPPLYHLGGSNYTEDEAMAKRFGVTDPVDFSKRGNR